LDGVVYRDHKDVWVFRENKDFKAIKEVLAPKEIPAPLEV
jgi:hypothetical protein